MKYIKNISISILVILLLYIYKFINIKYGFGIKCIFNEITGLYCPGCGITRLIFYILEFDFYKAFRSNCLVFIYLIISCLLFIDYKINNKKCLYYKMNNNIWIFILIVTIVFGVLRNTQMFSYFAPIN